MAKRQPKVDARQVVCISEWLSDSFGDGKINKHWEADAEDFIRYLAAKGFCIRPLGGVF